MKNILIALLLLITPAAQAEIQGIKLKTVVTSSSYTALTSDDAILVDASGGAKTVTLFSAASARGKVITIKKTDSSTNAVTVVPASGQTISGASSIAISIPVAGYMTIVSSGTGWVITDSKIKNPSIQTFLSGSGTYTAPTGPSPLYIRVRMVGGGGSGSTSSTGSAASGNTGGSTTFGGATAGGGSGGVLNNGATGGQGGAGGSATLGAGMIGTTYIGGGGGASALFYTVSGGNPTNSGAGGSSFLGGGAPGANSCAYFNANSNTGGGGAGGGGCTSYPGSGGGGGGGADFIINTPASSYAYSVGAGGTQPIGSGGASISGGTGGSGIIIVEEYYP